MRMYSLKRMFRASVFLNKDVTILKLHFCKQNNDSFRPYLAGMTLIHILSHIFSADEQFYDLY